MVPLRIDPPRLQGGVVMATKADAIKAELESIATGAGGTLTPAAVVEAARRPGSSLHDQFDWNDSSAASAHRMNQARTLIRSVKVKFVVESRTISAPCYVRDVTVDPAEQGYVRLSQVLTDKQAARKTIIHELMVAEGVMGRARAVAAVLESEEEIDGLILSARAFRERIEAGGDTSIVS